MLIIFPLRTKTTTLNQNENVILELLLETTQNHNLKVRILIAKDASADNIVEKLKEERNIEIKFIEPLPGATSLIDGSSSAETLLLIVDKQSALALASKETATFATPAIFFSDTIESL